MKNLKVCVSTLSLVARHSGLCHRGAKLKPGMRTCARVEEARWAARRLAAGFGRRLTVGRVGIEPAAHWRHTASRRQRRPPPSCIGSPVAARILEPSALCRSPCAKLVTFHNPWLTSEQLSWQQISCRFRHCLSISINLNAIWLTLIH